MAKSINDHREDIRTSIHGRRVGLTHDDYLVGPKQLKDVVTNATSDTTGTNILNHGFHTVSTTTNDGWVLDDPTPGCRVEIATLTTSTGTHAITPDNATIVSTNGVAGSSISMAALGARISLSGISTSQWLVTGAQAATVSS